MAEQPTGDSALDALKAEVVACRRCPRLTLHRERVAVEKRRAYLDCEYWGKPVPSLGRSDARLLIVGLAPGAHGANRTGRMFTGDDSGTFLFDTLHRFGFCNRPASHAPGDGLRLSDAYLTAAVRCVPPQNKPSVEEQAECRDYLVREIRLLRRVEVVVALGKLAWDGYLAALKELGHSFRPKPKFGHGAEFRLESGVRLLGSYHPSRQNTNTGTLTKPMFDAVFERARRLLEGAGGTEAPRQPVASVGAKKKK